MMEWGVQFLSRHNSMYTSPECGEMSMTLRKATVTEVK